MPLTDRQRDVLIARGMVERGADVMTVLNSDLEKWEEEIELKVKELAHCRIFTAVDIVDEDPTDPLPDDPNDHDEPIGDNFPHLPHSH